MSRHFWRSGSILAGAVAALVGLAGLGLAAEEPAPTLSRVAEWLENPIPEDLPFRLSGDVDLGVQELQGNRNSPNFQTYRVIENGFVANRAHLNLETKDQRWFTDFQGLDIHKDDQNYQVSGGLYGRFRFDLEWDQIPHLYALGARTPFVRSEGGVYTLPPGVAGLPLDDMRTAFNTSPLLDLKTRNDTGKVGLWWAPTSEWDLQFNYGHTRRAGNRPMGGGFGDPDEPSAIVVELPEPIDRRTEELNATAGYSTQAWQLQGGYRLSLFHDNIKTMTYDNPVFGSSDLSTALTSLGVTDITTVPQGRMALAPDNQYHNLFLAGGVNLPMATRFTAKVSYGMNFQNDAFTDHTINPLLADPSLALPSSSLHGDVRTLMANVTGTTRPIRDVTLTASYRLYDKDNRTPIQFFPGTVVRDSILDTGRFGRIFDYTKQNSDLDAAWRILKPLTLRAGFAWERWERPDTREVNLTDEYSGKAGLTYRPYSWLDMTARYIRSWKRIGEYHPLAALSHLVTPDDFPDTAAVGQSPLLRKYDEAARDRHKAEATLRVTPLKDLSLGGTLAYSQDQYHFSPLGLQGQWDWSGAAHLTYTPVAWLTVQANYTREEYHQKQRSRSRPTDSVTGDVGDFPDFDWISRSVDTFDTLGAGAVIRLIPDRLELEGNYAYQRSISRLNSSNPVTPTSSTSVTDAPSQLANATASDFPTDQFILQRVSVLLRYWLLKNLTVRLSYAYERFHVRYWRTDFIQPVNDPSVISGLALPSGGTDPNVLFDTFLAAKPFQSYEVHTFGIGLTYAF
jgi:MtrB/PioB family decaheme-associated outer membrane protein